jgi:hypothetical protein
MKVVDYLFYLVLATFILLGLIGLASIIGAWITGLL